MTARPADSHDHPRSARERMFGAKVRGPQFDSVPFAWWLSQFDAQLYATFVALGVPFLGYVLPYDNGPKFAIYSIFLAMTAGFWVLEFKQVIIQVDVFKELDQKVSDHQRTELQLLFWGVLIAVLFAAFPFVWYLASWKFTGVPVWWGPKYGFADVGILVHTLVVGYCAVDVVNAIITIIQGLMARIRRLEETTH